MVPPNVPSSILQKDSAGREAARQASAGERSCVTKRLPHRRCQPDTPGLRRQSRLAVLAVPLAQPLESRRSQLAGGSLLAAASAARSHLVDRAGRCGPPASSTRAGAKDKLAAPRRPHHLGLHRRAHRVPPQAERQTQGSSPRPSAGPPRTPAPPLHGAQAAPSSASRVPERLGTDRYSRRPDPAGGAAQAVHRSGRSCRDPVPPIGLKRIR